MKPLIQLSKLFLLSGQPKDFDFFKIYPATLKDIATWGEEEYHKAISILTYDVKRHPLIQEIPELAQESESVLFQILMKNSPDFSILYLNALNMFSRAEFKCVRGFFVLNEKFLKQEHIIGIREFIMAQNFIEIPPEFNPANEKAMEIKRKLEETRAKVQKIKSKQQENQIDLNSMILALVAKDYSYTFDNIWNLTYYQFRELLSKHQILDQYDLGIKQLLAGADSKKVEIKHWLLN